VIRPFLPLLALLLGGCFATTQQVQQLQTQLGQMRAESARRDSVELATLTRLVDTQQRMLDSLRSVRTQLATVKGDVSNDLYGIQQQLLQLQELTGQSQRRLSELRSQLEARGEQIGAPRPAAPETVPAGASGVADTTARPAPTGPSAQQMYDASLQQLRKGSASTARVGLQELVTAHPESELVPDALYFIGQSYASSAPDSASAYYQQVVQGHPKSPRAAAALYNLGLLAERRKDSAAAKEAYNQLTKAYPKSDEAALARDRLRAIGR
jgi:tol-pal system protein YbgF